MKLAQKLLTTLASILELSEKTVVLEVLRDIRDNYSFASHNAQATQRNLEISKLIQEVINKVAETY